MTKKIKKNIVAEGGGGCFPAGTKINTPEGYRFIEDIKAGDLVYAFDLTSREPGMPDEQPGRTFVKQVTETFKHSFGDVGYTSKLLNIEYHGIAPHGIVHTGTLIVTGNHYILTPSRQSEDVEAGFARADELEVGDKLWTEYGDEVRITSISDGDEYDFVYNFEVEDLHTYIASGIRVHNGGGGKSGGGGKQAPNTIRTNQVIRVLLCPSEGEIGGLYNQADIAQSVYFDGTPLKNADGTFNFNNVAVAERRGLPDQTVIEGFSKVESEVLMGIELKNSVAVTRAITAAIDAVRVTIEFTSGLQKIDKESGDANGTSVAFQLLRRVQNGTWETVVSPTVREMSSGPFTVSYLVQRPVAAGPWEFQVKRTTADATANEIIDKTAVKSYTQIQNVNLPYNNRALVAIVCGADSTNGRIPSIALDERGQKIKLPSNYNPSTRVYSGAWNGSFSTTYAVSDNPAWVIYDLLLHDRYGLGDKFDEDQIDKYSFYKAAQYCDELVNDGKGTGTMEPRFTFNAQLMVQENAWKTLNTIAATMNAKIYQHAGVVRIAQDRPESVTRLISNSNVVGGIFTYSSSTVEDTYTQCNVTYNDPEDNFLPKTVSEVASPQDRSRYGLNSTDLAAYGATSEGQARRAAKWVLYTSLKQSSIANFTVSLENAAFEPNEIFYLLDTDYSQTSQEGRLTGISGTTLTLDKPVFINRDTSNQGSTLWKITVYGADGATIEERTISTAQSTTSTIAIDSAITAPAGSPYIIAGYAKPRQFRLVSMTDNGDLTYNVSAVQHEPSKYNEVENGIISPAEVYWLGPSLNTTNMPSALKIVPQSAINPDGQVYRYLDVSWTAPSNAAVENYTVQWRRNGQPLKMEVVRDAFLRVDAEFSGIYEFYVNSVNSAGVTSPTLSGSYNFNFEGGATGGSLGAITGLQLEGGASSFNGAMRVIWNPPAAGVVKDYHVTLKAPAGTTPFKEFDVTSTGFVYSYDENVADGGPRPAIVVTVFARDLNNKLGPGVAATFSSQPAAGISNLFVRGTGVTTFSELDLNVTWDAISAGNVAYTADPNFDYFRVEVLNGTTVKRTENVTSAAYTYTFNDNIKDNGQDTPSNSITIRVTSFNKLGVAGASASATFTPTNPPAVTALFVKGTTGTTFNQEDLNATWSCNDTNGKAYSSSNVFKHYRIRVKTLTTDTDAQAKRTSLVYSADYSYTLAQNTLDHASAPVRNPTLVVSAVSMYNTESAPVSQTFSNPPPQAPTLDVLPGVEMLFMDATPQTVDTDIAGYLFHVSTTNNFTPSGTTVGTGTCVYAGPNSSYNMKATAGTTYYVKVAAFDTFGRTGTLNYSVQDSATISSPIVPTDYVFPGFVFTPNSPATNRVSWTAGTVQKVAGTGSPASYNVTAGSMSSAWTSGTTYIYWDEAVPTTFQFTSTISVATGLAKRIVAVYKGGTDIQLADGKVMIDGRTTIFPGTIDAPLLVTGSAVITGEAQIADLVVRRGAIQDLAITNAKIENSTIQDAKIVSVNAGKISTGAMTIKDANGNILFAAGNNSSLSDLRLPDSVVNSKMTLQSLVDKGLWAAPSGGKITNTNIDTFIANGAIKNLHFSSAVGDKLSASKIDTAGLEIKDSAGNVIFRSGTSTAFPLGVMPPETRNSNVTASSIGAIGNGNPITTTNVSTYIADAAIDTLRLRNGAITDTKIVPIYNHTTPAWSIGRYPVNTTWEAGVGNWRPPNIGGLNNGAILDTTVLLQMAIPTWSWFNNVGTITTTIHVEQIQDGGSAWQVVKTVAGPTILIPSTMQQGGVTGVSTMVQSINLKTDSKGGSNNYRCRVVYQVSSREIELDLQQIAGNGNRSFTLPMGLTAITQLR